jgi:hypothetical protein
MRESAGRRLLVAMLFALVAGAMVYFYNPMNHVRADLRADAGGIKLSFEVAADAIETHAKRLELPIR